MNRAEEILPHEESGADGIETHTFILPIEVRP